MGSEEKSLENAEIGFELTKVAHVTLQHEGLDSLAEKLSHFTKPELAKGEISAGFDMRTVDVPVSLLRETSEALGDKGYRSWAGSIARAAAVSSSI
jgi:hypothetical protein